MLNFIGKGAERNVNQKENFVDCGDCRGRASAGLRGRLAALAADGSDRIFAVGLLAEYDITVTGDALIADNAEIRQALANFVTDSDVAAYYEHQMPFWTWKNSWSPVEVVALMCYEGEGGECDTAWLEANCGGALTVETQEGSNFISLKGAVSP